MKNAKAWRHSPWPKKGSALPLCKILSMKFKLRITVGLKDRICVKHISGKNIYRCLINVNYYYTTVLLTQFLDCSDKGGMTKRLKKRDSRLC